MITEVIVFLLFDSLPTTKFFHSHFVFEVFAFAEEAHFVIHSCAFKKIFCLSEKLYMYTGFNNGLDGSL